MRARFLLAVGVTSFASFAALGVACLADLPDPTSPPTTEAGVDTGVSVDAGACPPPAQYAESSNCKSALQQDQGPTCPNDASVTNVMGCFAGPRSCACVNGECPIVDAGCFSTGCPRAVLDEIDASPSPSCTPLAGTDVVYDTNTPYGSCSCTCARCAAQCDGVGAIIASGSAIDDAGPYAPVSFVLLEHIPQQGGGSLGFYARLRVDAAGVGGAAFFTFGSQLNSPPRVEYPVVFGGPTGIPVDGQFHELVFYAGTSVPSGIQVPDSWSSPETAPETLLLTTANYQTIVEVDCVIPFFLPE